MAGKRDFEAAAQRRAVDGGDNRFRRVFDLAQHLVKAGWLWRFAEFGDVGTGDKSAAGTGQHDRLHFRVRNGALDTFQDTAALSALTGGLSTVTMATTSRRSSLTTSLTALSLNRMFLYISHCGIQFRILTTRVILKHVPCQRGARVSRGSSRQ